MPDVWATVAALDSTTQERLAATLELRGADPQQRAMRQLFLADVHFPAQAQVLDIGCGIGVLARVLARLPAVGTVVGVDPAPSLLAKAQELSADIPNVTFQEADGRSLPFSEGSFDVVIFDSTLSHVPDREGALAEAYRVLRLHGCLAIFDGDYATTTVALGEHDPLQACADAMMAGSVDDPWLVRRLPAAVTVTGFAIVTVRSHGFVERSGGYLLTIVDRGADMMENSGQIGSELTAALKTEARRRIEAGTFFGHIGYASLIAFKRGVSAEEAPS